MNNVDRKQIKTRIKQNALGKVNRHAGGVHAKLQAVIKPYWGKVCSRLSMCMEVQPLPVRRSAPMATAPSRSLRNGTGIRLAGAARAVRLVRQQSPRTCSTAFPQGGREGSMCWWVHNLRKRKKAKLYLFTAVEQAAGWKQPI